MDVRLAYVGAATFFAMLAGFFISRAIFARRAQKKNRVRALNKTKGDVGVASWSAEGIAAAVLSYLVGLEQRLRHKMTPCLTAGMSKLLQQDKGRFADCARHAGIEGRVSQDTVRESRLRIGFIAGAVCAVVGACLSNELAVLGGVAGVVAGALLPGWAIGSESRARSDALKRELPEMLEVVCLGMNSGLTFDRAFGLYHAYFDTRFARDCARAQQKWLLGFSTREEALRELASGYDSPLFARVVESIARAMKFGTSLVRELEKAAEDSQAEQKAARQEQVAKAPIRMMVPTAALILPAMLLLVLGPVILELMEGF